MKTGRHFWRFLSLMSLIGLMLGCTYESALRQLPPEEQAEFRVYRQLMKPRQARTYLSKATAAERQAYLRETGLLERFQALGPKDRNIVLSGHLQRGASAEALRFLWGEPYFTEGRQGYYERWFYVGSSFSLAETGNETWSLGTQVVVHLIDGRVTSWLDFVPDTADDAGDGVILR